MKAYHIDRFGSIGGIVRRSAEDPGRGRRRSRWLAPLAGALRRLRIVGGVGIVFGYSRDEPASGDRLQVRLQRVSNLLGIDLPVVHVERKGF